MKRWTMGGASAMLALALFAAGCAGERNGATAGGSTHDTGLRLAPDPANVNAQIAAVVDAPDADPRLCTYQWSRNGAQIAEASGSTLDPVRFRKGDRIGVAVGVPGTNGRPGRTLNAELRVGNAPPAVTAIALATAPGASGTEVRATPEYSDPDGDEVTCTYQWLRNGQAVAGATTPAFVVTNLGAGDRVCVDVTADDGDLRSEARRSEEVRFDNRPPAFTSQPVALSPTEATFRYQAVAADPDGDPLRYELVRGPAGMTVAPNGALEWPLPPPAERAGVYEITVRATDGKGGEAIQRFTLRLGAPTAKSNAS